MEEPTPMVIRHTIGYNGDFETFEAFQMECSRDLVARNEIEIAVFSREFSMDTIVVNGWTVSDRNYLCFEVTDKPHVKEEEMTCVYQSFLDYN